MSKSIYNEVLERLKQNKEVELYKFGLSMYGELVFYRDKVYKAEDGEKITRSVVHASVYGGKYRLETIKCVGTALIRGKSFIVEEHLYDLDEHIATLSFDDINDYSFSITEAMKERASDESCLYFLGKDGSLYEFNNVDGNKKTIESLLSKGLISKLEDFKEIENE